MGNGTKQKMRGTSSAPMVLGIVGGAIGLPSSVCSGACAAGVTTDASLGDFYLYGCAIISIALIVVACFSKKAPKAAGALMLLLTICGFVMFGCSFNMLGIIAMILTLIGAILSIVQKKEPVE